VFLLVLDFRPHLELLAFPDYLAILALQDYLAALHSLQFLALLAALQSLGSPGSLYPLQPQQGPCFPRHLGLRSPPPARNFQLDQFVQAFLVPLQLLVHPGILASLGFLMHHQIQYFLYFLVPRQDHLVLDYPGDLQDLGHLVLHLVLVDQLCLDFPGIQYSLALQRLLKLQDSLAPLEALAILLALVNPEPH